MPLALAPARSKMRVLRDEDVVAHWRMLESGSTSIGDETGDGDLVCTTSANIVGGPFIGETSGNYGRTFGSPVYAQGPSSAAQRAALLAGDYTIEAWLRPTSVTGINAILCHGSNSSGEANNYLASLRLNGAAIEAFWQRTSSKTGVTVTSAAAPVELGVLQHLAIRVRTVSTNRIVDFFHNGLPIGSSSTVSPPTGGSTGVWEMGALAGSHGSPFDGDIFDVRVAGIALSDEAIRDSAARGLRDFDLSAVIESGLYEVYGRAFVRRRDGGEDMEWIDLSNLHGFDFIESMEWGFDVDDEGHSGTLTLVSEFEALSVVPFLGQSRPNFVDPLGQLLDTARGVRLEAAIVPWGTPRDGVDELDWQLVFDGRITDVAFPDGRVTLQLADRFRELSRTWIEPDRTPTPTLPPRDFGPYGSTSGLDIDAELQRLIDDLEPSAGYLGGSVVLWVPVPSSWATREFWAPPDQSVGQLLQNKAGELGWLIHYLFDELRQEWRCAFYEPDRTKSWTSGDPTLAPEVIRAVERLEFSDDTVRNRVAIEAGLATDGDNTGHFRRREYLYVDAVSEERYGPLYCRIGLASTTSLNTSTEVDRLGAAALSDMSEPKAHLDVTIPFRWDLIVGDMIRFGGDDRRFDTRDQAVTGLRHRIAKDDRSTRLSTRAAKPIGRRWQWFNRIVGGVIKADGWTAPKAPAGLIAEAIANGVRLGFTLPVNHGNRAYRETELHVSTSSGFTPTSATLRGLVRGGLAVDVTTGLTPGTTYYAKAVHRDEMGNYSSASAAVAFTPRALTVAPGVHATRSSNATIGSSTPDVVIWNQRQSGTDTAGDYSTSTGVWTTRISGMHDIDASVLYDSDGKPGADAYLTIEVDRGSGYVVARTGVVGNTGAGDQVVVTAGAKLWLNAGDLVRVRIHHGNGNAASAVVADAESTRLAITLAFQPT